MTDIRVYRRDASWHHNPGTSGGKYHIASTTDSALAACSNMIVLNEQTERGLSLILAAELCGRCRKVLAPSTPTDPTEGDN